MPERRGAQPNIAADLKLTLFVIGDGQSTHVMTRVRCFAELGHRVFLITGRRSPNGIEGVTELRPVEETALLLGRQAVLDVLVLDDLGERAPAVVLAYDVARDVLFG